MKKAICLVSLTAVFLFGSEPSAFKAGDLDAPNPYGLTNSEKKIVEQNKNIKTIKTKLFDTAQSQQELRNEIDGIKSLVIGHSEKIRDFDRKISSDDNNSLKTLEKRFEANLALQNENYDKIMDTLSAIAALLDETREEYVSKAQLKAIVGKSYKELGAKKHGSKLPEIKKDQNKTAKMEDKNEAAEKEDQKAENKSDQKSSVQSIDESFKVARQHFRDGKLDDSKKEFENIIKIDPNYKRGLIQYYLGESEYKNGNYKVALEHFQSSIEADEKASYIPTILYHTGISLEKLGDKESAKKIFNSLIDNYPKDNLVKSAKKKLAEIK